MSKNNGTPLQALSKNKQKIDFRNKAPKRLFGGKLSDFKDEWEKKYYGKMLKAYLAGKPIFTFGYHEVLNSFGAVITVPKEYLVEFRDESITKDSVEQLLADGYTDKGCEFVINTPGAKRTSHAQIKDRKFQRSEDQREKDIEAINADIKLFNKGKKKAEKKEPLVFVRQLVRPGSKTAKLLKLAKERSL